jgi:hypothetical protein
LRRKLEQMLTYSQLAKCETRVKRNVDVEKKADVRSAKRVLGSCVGAVRVRYCGALCTIERNGTKQRMERMYASPTPSNIALIRPSSSLWSLATASINISIVLSSLPEKPS